MKTLLAKTFVALAALSIVFSIASCCCIGGSDSDNNGDTHIVSPGQHNEGAGGGV